MLLVGSDHLRKREKFQPLRSILSRASGDVDPANVHVAELTELDGNIKHTIHTSDS